MPHYWFIADGFGQAGGDDLDAVTDDAARYWRQHGGNVKVVTAGPTGDVQTVARPWQVTERARTLPYGNPQVVPDGDGYAIVSFRWATDHGPCYDCGAPAGWTVLSENMAGKRWHTRLCAVCACNCAADGSRPPVNIAQHVEEHGHAPDEPAPDEQTGQPTDAGLAPESEP